MALRNFGSKGIAAVASVLPRLEVRLGIQAHDMAQALSGMDMEVWQAQPDESAWSIARVDIQECAFFVGESAAPHFARGAPEYVFAVVQLGEDADWTINGHHVASNEVVVFAPGSEWAGTSSHACRWGAVRIPMSHLVRFAESIGACDLSLKRGQTRFVPVEREISGEFRQLFQVALSDGLNDGAAAIGDASIPPVERHALSTLVQNLQGSLEPPRSTHEDVVARSLAYLREHENDVVYVADLCLALGVSDRWLRESFHRIFRTNPAHILRLRRLNQARRHLTSAPDVGSVSAVAAMYGFFDFGRFSMAYRSLFGELPSATLQRRAP